MQTALFFARTHDNPDQIRVLVHPCEPDSFIKAKAARDTLRVLTVHPDYCEAQLWLEGRGRVWRQRFDRPPVVLNAEPAPARPRPRPQPKVT